MFNLLRHRKKKEKCLCARDKANVFDVSNESLRNPQYENDTQSSLLLETNQKKNEIIDRFETNKQHRRAPKKYNGNHSTTAGVVSSENEQKFNFIWKVKVVFARVRNSRELFTASIEDRKSHVDAERRLKDTSARSCQLRIDRTTQAELDLHRVWEWIVSGCSQWRKKNQINYSSRSTYFRESMSRRLRKNLLRLLLNFISLLLKHQLTQFVCDPSQTNASLRT